MNLDLQTPLTERLPTSDELPCSDDTPVDNEDQNFLPNFLLFLLSSIWAQRMDWYFGVDMGVYHTTGPSPNVPVVPDGFLSIGVERRKGGKSRKSYVTWEEQDIVPIFVLEMVSWTPGGEYDEKLETYQKLGVLYYLIYNPEYWQRDRQQPFELYKLINDQYQLQIGEPFWMPEIGLSIGRHRRVFDGVEHEFLYWYNAQRDRYLATDEQAQSAKQEAQSAKQEAQSAKQEAQSAKQEVQSAKQEAQSAKQEAQSAKHRTQLLEEKLRELGLDPDTLS